MGRNKFWIVHVEDVERESGRAVLRGECLPGNQVEFTPVLKSWKLVPIREKVKQLGCGVYYRTGNEIRDGSDLGFFSTIHEAPVVLELGTEVVE